MMPEKDEIEDFWWVGVWWQCVLDFFQVAERARAEVRREKFEC